jgi:hypothetical protein
VIRDCLLQGLKNPLSNSESLSLHNLFDKYHAGLHIKSDYRGCVGQDGRDKKNKKVLEELKQKVEGNEGVVKVDSLYTRAIEELTNKINRLNGSYSDELVRAVRSNVEYHKGFSEKYSEKIKGVINAINEKRDMIKNLEDEVIELALQVDVEHKDLLLKDVNGWDNTPSDVKERLSIVIDKIEMVGFSVFPSDGDGKIRI